MARTTHTPSGLDRREFLAAAGLAGAGSILFGSTAWAATERYPEVRKAAEAAREASIKRIQDWIAQRAPGHEPSA